MKKNLTFLFSIFLSMAFLLPDMALALALSPQTRGVANAQNHFVPNSVEKQKGIYFIIQEQREQAVTAIAQLSSQQYPNEQEKTLVYPGGCVDILRALPLTRAGVRTFIFFNKRKPNWSLHLPEGQTIYYNPTYDLPTPFFNPYETNYAQEIILLLLNNKACRNFQTKEYTDQFSKIEISFEYKMGDSDQYVPIKIILFDVDYEAPNFFTEFLELPELKNKAHFLFSRRSYLPNREWVIHVINKISAPNGLITISDEWALQSLPNLFTKHIRLFNPKLVELPKEQALLLEQANKFGFVEKIKTPDFKVCIIDTEKLKILRQDSFAKRLPLIYNIRGYFNLFDTIDIFISFIKQNFTTNDLPFLQKMIESVYIKEGFSKASDLEGYKQLIDAALLLYAEPEILQNLLSFDESTKGYPILSAFYSNYKKHKFLEAEKIKQTENDIFFLKDMTQSIQKIHAPALIQAFSYLTKKELEQLKKEIEVYYDLFLPNDPNKNFWLNLISNIETIIGNREERLNTIIFKDVNILSSLNQMIEKSLLEVAA